MSKRTNHLLACFAGCVVGSLFGLLIMLKLDAPILAMLSAGVFPAIWCRMSGITDKKQLGKIAAYAAVGWILTYMLKPSVAGFAASHTRQILTLPLLGYGWHIPASVVSTLLALVGAYFVPVHRNAIDESRAQ